jgi:hypothetical protein
MMQLVKLSIKSQACLDLDILADHRLKNWRNMEIRVLTDFRGHLRTTPLAWILVSVASKRPFAIKFGPQVISMRAL